ncbi:MAG: heavy-metal-associated domain-containing protein [Brevinematia bacterium]
MDRKDLNIRVIGMSCNSCEIKIQEVLLKKDGIYRARANKNKNLVSLQYDPEKVHIDNIKDIIKDLGYKVEGILLPEKQKFSIFSYLPYNYNCWVNCNFVCITK